MFGDLSEALADVSFELGVWVGNQSCEVWDGTLVNDGLSELFCVFCDF